MYKYNKVEESVASDLGFTKQEFTFFVKNKRATIRSSFKLHHFKHSR